MLYSKMIRSQLYQQTDFMYADAIEYSPISHTCELGSVSSRPAAFVAIVPTLFDLLLLVLTAYKAMRSPTSLKTNTIVRVESWLSPCGALR